MLKADIIYKTHPKIEISSNDISTITNAVMELQNIIAKEQNTNISIVLCNNNFISKLNQEHRNQNKATNVLSFPYFTPEQFKQQNRIIECYLGDIIISTEKIIEEAKTQNKSENAHFTHLLIHGILHLLGYNHIEEKEAETMEKLEVLILKKLGYKDPY